MKRNASDLIAALAPLAAALEALGVPYFLGGSLATAARGIARSADADVIARLRDEHVEPLAGRLAAVYYHGPGERMRAAVTARTSCPLLYFATMFRIELFVSKGRAFDREAETRARAETIGIASDSLHLPVASVEDTVLAKLEWFRVECDTSERLWWDIVGLLKVTQDVDGSYLHRWAAVLGVADLLEQALAAAARGSK
jgi:hypothetical protein